MFWQRLIFGFELYSGVYTHRGERFQVGNLEWAGS